MPYTVSVLTQDPVIQFKIAKMISSHFPDIRMASPPHPGYVTPHDHMIICPVPYNCLQSLAIYAMGIPQPRALYIFVAFGTPPHTHEKLREQLNDTIVSGIGHTLVVSEDPMALFPVISAGLMICRMRDENGLDILRSDGRALEESIRTIVGTRGFISTALEVFMANIVRPWIRKTNRAISVPNRYTIRNIVEEKDFLAYLLHGMNMEASRAFLADTANIEEVYDRYTWVK